MFIKIVRQDLANKKIITFVLFIFLMLSAFLLSTASSMVVKLIYSLEYMSAKSQAPDFVQLNNGAINSKNIDPWANTNNLVKQNQIVEVLNIDGEKVFLAKNKLSEANSIMSFDFVTQNKYFDFILDLQGNVVHLTKGQIAVPVYFVKQNHLQIGDTVTILKDGIQQKFTIVSFVRDYLMNPSIIHSKRFLISQDDYNFLRDNINQIGNLQYLIEFQLMDQKKLDTFTNQYQASNLPQKGPVINYHLLKILNSVTDGSVIGVLILLSVLLAAIAMLSLRFTILVSLEEDYRQIGIMKAIGIRVWDIKRLYLLKYVILAGFSCIFGYIGSLILGGVFQSNILLYLGTPPKNFIQFLIPFCSSLLVFILIINFCLFVIRKIQNISAVEALKIGIKENQNITKKMFLLNKSNLLNINILLGLKDVFNRPRLFILLFLIFFVCTFIVIAPINFLNTIQSPNFITYLGIGRSDARIDLQLANNTTINLTKLVYYLRQDESIKKFSILTTTRYEYIKKNGTTSNINIEVGNFSLFPLTYLQGKAPQSTNQIALSYLNSKELNLKIGDDIELLVDKQLKKLIVSGIYQDVTNGGMTAKAILPVDHQKALWEVVNIDFKSNIDLSKKIAEYSQQFAPARVTYLNDYLSQTLGDLIKQIKVIIYLAVLVGFFVAMLIASLFLKMLIAKDYSQIAIMKAIGFSLDKLRIQYLVKSLLILSLAIVLGVVVANVLGQEIVSFLWSFMGAPKISFVIKYSEVYFFIPIILLIIVSLTTLLSTGLIKKIGITKMISE